jgi:hypothetical protein
MPCTVPSFNATKTILSAVSTSKGSFIQDVNTLNKPTNATLFYSIPKVSGSAGSY